MSQIHDHAGKKFGRLTVTKFAGLNKHKKATWHCDCDCGTSVVLAARDFVSGRTQSCGCLHNELLGKARHIHGQSDRTPEYNVWKGMRQRCRNPNSEYYDRYGKRGIQVCKRWDAFENFLQDMGERPGPEYTIERTDNDGHYEPDNCRWATREEQGNNTSRNVAMTHNGRTQSLRDWATETGINRAAIRQRILRRGWTVERALTTPIKENIKKAGDQPRPKFNPCKEDTRVN